MPTRIVVAGGGVAATEAVAALRAIADPALEIVMVAPSPQMERRPHAVTAPFGDPQAPLSLAAIAEHLDAELRLDGLDGVDAPAHEILLTSGDRVGYDTLVVATGAVPRRPFPGATVFGSAADSDEIIESLRSEQVVFVIPAASGWSLPIYEMALLAKRQHPETQIAVVTAEREPMWLFGPEAGQAVGGLLAQRGVGLLTGVRVAGAQDGELHLIGAEPIAADRAIALPAFVGPGFAGLPADPQGFIPVDDHGAVPEVPDVYAAGDVTAYPFKQGGLAADQADAVALSIAAALGADVDALPFRPVLRGLLLSGGDPLYVRSDGTRGSGTRLATATVSENALWWPPTKVAARYFGPILAMLEGGSEDPAPLHDFHVPEQTEQQGRLDAFEVALLLADEDAYRGDYPRALKSLDSAEAMTGEPLPIEWQRARTMWRARLKWR